MSTDEPSRDDFTTWRTLPTRWGDEDVYGHINNVVYYAYFDTAVNGWLMDALGTDIRDLPALGVVAETAERVCVQYAGQKVEEQEVAQLFADPHHPYTFALLAALPERAVTKRLPSIPGVVPGLFNRPPACLFSPRCRFATDLCRTIAPPRQPPSLGLALCHYPLISGHPQNHPVGSHEAAE